MPLMSSLKLGGVTYEICDLVARAGGGGGEDAPILVGNTPYKLLRAASALVLSGSGSVSYSLQSDTVADFDILEGTKVQCTIAKDGDYYKLTAGSVSSWYQTYLEVTVGGLTVGTNYNFIFDGQGVPDDPEAHQSVGHYILYDANDETLATRASTDGANLNSYAFTATTTSVKLRWYPAPNNTFSSGVSTAYCNRIYINRAGTTAHTGILDTSGTFTNSVTVRNVPAGTTISSTPSCAIYASESSGGGSGSSHLKDKTVVCFGDSLFGLYRGETSTPAFVAERTGATVYNVGFGGCRMSVHPSNGYAAFSMWALADAVATNTWTTQDAQASAGQDYFAETLATLKSIDFSAVDFIVIHYGTNDFGSGVVLDDSSNKKSTSTLCGALRYSIEKILTAYPEIFIFVSLPIYRMWNSVGAETYTNSRNKTLYEYAEAMAEVAKSYGCPVIDGLHDLGFNAINFTTFSSDKTHLSAVSGRRRFGYLIGGELDSKG